RGTRHGRRRAVRSCAARRHARLGRVGHRAARRDATSRSGGVSLLRVALATKNPGKVREIASILAEAPIELTGPDAVWVPPPEDEPTYRGNALTKARSLLSLSSGPCLADDSGIEVDALDGGPGPRSARYAGEGASDEENLHKLIEVVRRTPERARGARYRCVAVIVVPWGEEHVVEAIVQGTLI